MRSVPDFDSLNRHLLGHRVPDRILPSDRRFVQLSSSDAEQTPRRELQLSEILDVPPIQSLMNDFHAIVNIPMAVIDISGKVLVGVGWQEICTEFHRVHPEACKNCIESDTQSSAGVPVGEYKLYRCKNNMWDVATPLVVDGQHVGNIFTGQFFFDDEPLDYDFFREQARRYGFNEQQYLDALNNVPRLSRETVHRGMSFLMKLAQIVSGMGYANLKLSEALAERKLSEEALSKNEKLLRRFIDAELIGVVLSNRGQIEFANDTFLTMLGYTREELEQGLLHSDNFTLPDYLCRRDEAINRLEATGLCQTHESLLRRKDGTYVPALVGFAQNEEPGKRVAWVLDMSRQKELEAKLLQTQKLEAVGELAGGIAHDFNNLLMVISSHAELILDAGNDIPRVTKSASSILASADRGTQLTSKLLTFSRKQELAISPFDVNELLSDSADLVSRLLPKTIDFQVHRSASPCWVMADRTQLEQVMLNLILNARDAMPDGGKLVVRASGVMVGHDDVGLHGAVPIGEYALITVADTGFGIPKHIADKIFEPFFTTKPKGRGTGLGLAMAYGIVTQSGGHIRVKSGVNVGTTMSVYLASTETQIAEQARSVACGFRNVDGSACPVHGTVLLVDDEDLVRSSVRAFLENKGLKVVDTGDAREAIRIADEIGDGLSMLITDVIMPKLTGTELARTLLSKHPSLSVVFMSGYAAGAIHQEEFPSAKFLQKPFNRATLIDAVCSSSECKNMSQAEGKN